MILQHVERPFSWRGLASAIPDFFFGGIFLVAWIDPSLLPADSGRYLLGLLVLEFIIIHTSTVLGSAFARLQRRSTRIINLLAVSLAFSLAVALMARRLEQPWLLSGFWVLTANRLAGVLFSRQRDEAASEFLFRSWLSAVGLYTLCLWLGWMISVPALGVTASFLPADLPYFGWFSREPQRFLAVGYAYFTATALAELTDFAWMRLEVSRLAMIGKYGFSGLIGRR